MDFKEIIKAHLEQMAEQDPAFAERYALETKSLDDCVKYIMSEARKQASHNCAAIEDAVVFGWAAHYYQEDDVKFDNNVKAKVVTPKAEKKPKEVKPVKALVKYKRGKGCKCVEMDLFAGLF